MSDPFDVFVFKVGQNKPTRKQPNTRQPTLFPRVGVTHRHHPYPYPSSIPSTSASTSPSTSAFSQFPSNPEMTSSPPTSPPMMSPIEELGTFSSCEVSDALVKLGLTHNASERPVQRGGCIPDIQMLSPSPHDMVGQNRRICGYAYTVKMVRGDDVHAPKPTQHFVDAAPEGCVVVISVPPNIKSAAWGGLMTAGAQFRGVHGVVIDGRARDLVEHRASGFPVFARGSSTLGQSPFTRPSELNVPITILPRQDFENHFENTFSAVEVHPGDAIVADIDGVVCVPRELIGKVLDSCRYSKEVDERCAIDIRQGRGIQETFQLWRKATTGRKRLLSPAAALANNTSPKVDPGSQSPTAVSPRVAARNILKSTLSLVPRTLVNEQQLLWEQRVRSALDDLETGKSRPLRVAVWGDGLSGASEIVTGLLDDPLSDDLDQRSMLHQRWASVQQSGSIHIKRTELASWDGSILGIKSNWLRNINAEIIECRDGKDINALDTLLSCDHVILVTDNLRRLSAPGLQEILRGLVHAPSVKLVVTERAPGVPAPSDDLEKSKSALVKPEIAVQGLEAFSRGDVNEYQTLLMASGLPQFAREITERYAQSNQPSSSSSSASIAMVRTAAHIARTTLSTCDAAINGAQESLSTTVAPVEPLKAEVSAVGPAALKSVLQGTTTVREGVSVAEARLRAAYERLPWYSLWWRADEVASTLRETITWGSLDTQLSFHAGRLASIRQHLYGKTVALSVSSPVLKNQLAQLNARTPIGPDALSSPLAQRTAQLLAPGGPVEDVQRRAQAAVVATSANIVGSGVLSAGLFAIGSIGAGTAVGAGLLGAVGSVRWMQSMWSNAEKKWWADWGRVCAGLERDCEATLNEVVRERVVKSAVVGIQGVEALATQRAKTISTLKVELSGLSRELGNLEQRLG